MPDDRFTLVKMNINMYSKSESRLQMTFLPHVLDFYKVTFQCPFLFLLMKGFAAHLHEMT